jgi:hypothetical protein
MAATTTLLSLVTPTQGTLSGTWGDTVNYGISDYLDIAIAGTLSFAGDGAITLANTVGSASGNAITSTTAQYMVIRITGTQTVAKVITGPSYSKLYMVDHAGATSAVTFKAAGQTGVSVAVGEKCFVYYNGTDYVKVASSLISASNISGVVGPANGGTGVSNNAASTLTISGAFTTALTVTATTAVTLPTTGTLATLAGSETLTNKTLTTPIIASISNTGTLTLPTSTDTLVGRATTDTLTNKTLTSPILTTPQLGTPSQGVLSSCTVDGTNKVGYLNIPQSGSSKTTSYTLAVGDVGEYILLGASGAIVIPDATFAAGDAVTIFNNTASTATITCSITTAYIAGTFTDKATMTLAAAGVATVLFITSTLCVVSGNVT